MCGCVNILYHCFLRNTDWSYVLLIFNKDELKYLEGLRVKTQIFLKHFVKRFTLQFHVERKDKPPLHQIRREEREKSEYLFCA